MNISELPIDARALLYFHIRSTEHYLTGKINEDQSMPYVKFRERTLTQLAIGGADVMQMQVINRFGGMCRLFDASYCLTAIQKSIKGNSQRAVVRNLLWQFMDELEFDMHINSDTAYNYKWNLVNQIIKDKLFG